MRRSGVRRLAGYALVAVLLGACATRQPGTAGAAPPPSGHGVPAAATRQRVLAPFDSTQVDTVPSADANLVLNTIPDPLAPFTPGAKPPAVPIPAGPDSVALGAPPDTSGAGADSTQGVPTPEPTAPLGDAPGTPTETALPEFAPQNGAGAAGAGAAGAAGAVAAPPPAPAGPCWHVQVASWPDQAKSEGLRQTAESLLLVPMTLVNADGHWKVRTRDCLDAEAAESLRLRAEESGFTGAFRSTDDGSAAAGPKPATKPAAKPAAKKKKKTSSGAAGGK